MQGLRNIVVTGSNKGIGYGIVENLAAKGGWNIIMACRDAGRGKKSQEELLAKYPNASIQVEQLDVSNKESVEQFVKVIEDKYKNIDVLLNNAGVAAKGDSFDSDVANFTFATNFYGTIDLSEALLKYVSNNGKIIFVGSMAGKLTRIQNESILNRFKSPNLNRKELFDLVEEFTTAVKEGNYAEKGWPKWIYGVSKIGINLYAKVLAKFPEVIERKVQVYACCPGYVNTDMTSGKGVLTIEQGALTPVFLAQLPFEVNPEYQGQFFEKSALSSLY